MGSSNTTPLDIVGLDDVAAIAELCKRALTDPPSVEELAACLFAEDQPAVVRGDPSVGVVASVSWEAQGYIRLLVVDPSKRLRGHGRALLAAAESDLSGMDSVTVGADPPYYLYPGVETSLTPMLCLLERCRYHRSDANYNVGIDLTRIPDPPPEGCTIVAGSADRDEVAEWTTKYWPNWTPEVLRALDRTTLLLSRDSQGISGFCAYDVNRAGFLGPVAVRTDLIGSGRGEPLLVAALHRMRDGGRNYAEISWVGPLVPYAQIGGFVSRVFFVYRKTLRPKMGNPGEPRGRTA